MSTSSRKAAMAKKDSATARPPRMKIKKGDHVIVLAGKDKGATGQVIAAFPATSKVVVEGVNMIKKNKKVKIGRASCRERVLVAV